MGLFSNYRLLFACSLGAALGLVPAFTQAAGPVTLADHIKPMLKEYCFDCHNPQKQKGDLDLIPVAENGQMVENREVWEKIAELIETREMPPEKGPQPTDEQRDTLLKYIDGQLSKVDCTVDKNPGKVTIRRLNKEEYKNTIRDLLGVNYVPEDFPNDEVGYGYDNIGDVLSLPPMLMEKFLAAAEEIAQKAIVTNPMPQPVVQTLRLQEFGPQVDQAVDVASGRLSMMREAEVSRAVELKGAGEHIIRVRAFGDPAGPEAPKLKVSLDGKELRTFDVTALDKPQNYEVRVTGTGAPQKLSVAYLNNYVDENNPDPKLRGDRNLHIVKIEIESPPVAPALPESHKRLITRVPTPGQEREVANEIIRGFAQRAYRRPVTDTEVTRLVGFVDLAQKNGGTFYEGIQAAVQAALCSPHFLFRWELDPEAMKPGDTRALNDYEVASRLSYFLWSSMPDAELFALAGKGELLTGGNLEKQALRMMQDGRARAFVTNFAGQWLQIRNIYEASVDPDTFPKWDDSLKGAMKEETERFFEAIMKEDRPVTELIEADFTFLNEKLAKFYGLEGVKGKDFQRVTLPASSPRGGVLTQGSVLVSTSTPTRTSPVIRGKWILEQILGTPPPPPPPDVPPLNEQRQVNQTASLRQRFEQHRSAAECSGCHARMDPLGFALENFDATGAWRETDGKFPVDASGKLTNGTTFNGPKELKQVLKGNKNFVRSLTHNMMTYALGRGLEFYDRCAADVVMVETEKRGLRFSALVTGIVTSDPFLKRKRDLAQN
jgi:mono/diheme cytochrome c family protein